MQEFFFYLILGILIFNYFLSQALSYLNQKTWKEKMPAKLVDFYSEEEYEKAREYNHEKNSLGFKAETFNFILLIIFILAGGFGFLHHWILGITDHLILHALIYFGILGIISDLLNLPFSLYNTFKLEEKYGFNRTTPRLYFIDKIKGYLLGALIGGSIMWLVLWLILELGPQFWIYAWAVLIVIMVFTNMFYSSLILPLFNKLTPLGEGELREAIETYARKVDFPLQNIFVIDGSKRSSKANAFFSGFGKQKKIVLYDTLIEKHTTEELVAVLAHEAGHFKMKHIITGMVLGVLQTGLTLFLFSLFVFSTDLSLALRAQEWSLPINIIAFGILYGPISMLLGLGMNILSRKHEFEADEYAAKTYDGNALQQALKRLGTTHLSNLEPHPAYVFFNYSHPPLLQRLETLDKVS